MTLLNIDWGVKNPLVSTKDQLGDLFENFQSQF